MVNNTNEMFALEDQTITCLDRENGSCCMDPLREKHRYNDCDIKGDHAGDPGACCLNLTSNTTGVALSQTIFDTELINMTTQYQCVPNDVKELMTSGNDFSTPRVFNTKDD